MLHQIQYAVKQGCVRLRNALECISEAIFTVTESRVADLGAAVTIVIASATDCLGEADADNPYGRPRAQTQRM